MGVGTKSKPDEDADLRKLLVERGLRATLPRIVILRELASLDHPIGHPELSDRLSSVTLDRATVYRNLIALTDAGILARTDLGDHVARFQLVRAGGTTHGQHPHLLCNDCGGMECLPGARLALRGASAGVSVDEIQVRGRCHACVDD